MKITHLTGKVSTALLTASAFLATASPAYAQIQPGTIGAIPVVGNRSLSQLIYQVINIALGIIGVIAVIYLIWGGVTYITAGGDAEKAGKGRVAITNAIIGIIIIIAALVIYRAVVNVGTSSTSDFNSL